MEQNGDGGEKVRSRLKPFVDFGHAFSNYTYFRPCGRIWFSSVQRPRRLVTKKRKKEEIKKHW